MGDDPRVADRQHRAPTTESGEALRRAVQFNQRLAETGDTPRSFVVKGLIGIVVMLSMFAGAGWLLLRLVRWLLS
jgi:hypothetical protein